MRVVFSLCLCLVTAETIAAFQVTKAKKPKPGRTQTDVYAMTASTYEPFPAGEPNRWLRSGVAQHDGCNCATEKDVAITPLSVNTRVGQKVKIKFDGTQVCIGQGTLDVKGISADQGGRFGYVKWEEGSTQYLPSTFGYLTFDGYEQAGTNRIDVFLTVRCVDTGPACKQPGHYVTCPLVGSIPVVVTP